MNSYLASLGPALANHLWQSTAFVLLAWMLTLALHRNQARVRYAIWLAATIKFLVPFSLLVFAGNLLPRPRQTVAPIVYSAMDLAEAPFTVSDLPPARPKVYVPTLSERVKADVPSGIAILWLIGVGTVLLGWWNRWRIVSRSVRKSVLTTAGREFEILRQLEGDKRPLALLLSGERMEPGIFGVFRPGLVWPQQLSAHLDDHHIESIVAHELAHVRRRDNLTAVVHMLVEAVFWFHPFVWWMERQMVKEREQACDEAVVEMGGSAETYAESLLKTCWFCLETPLPCVAGVTGADLKRRVRDIVTGCTLLPMTWQKKLLLAGAAGCVVATPVIAGQAKAAQRMMLAVVEVAPKPLQLAAHAAIPEFEMPSTELIAEASQEDDSSGSGDKAKSLRFDVVSVRPWSSEAKADFGLAFTADGMYARGVSLAVLLEKVYELEFMQDRILEAPDWARTQLWDIEAKVDESDIADYGRLAGGLTGAGNQQRDLMLQALLADEFHLKLHREKREGVIYSLVVANGGLKIKPGDPNSPPHMMMRRRGHFEMQNAVVGALVPLFAQELGRPVIDKTGLTGTYDITLDWQPDNSASAAADSNGKPSLFTALEEQLGLKLVASKGPVDVVVIDHIEKPTADGAEVGAARLVNAAYVQDKTPGAAVVPIKFDVVTIKPAAPGEQMVVSTRGDVVIADDVPMSAVIQFAYFGRKMGGMDAINGLPAWATSDRWDIEAKVAPEDLAVYRQRPLRIDDPPDSPGKLMLQAMLAERLHLVVHYISSEIDGYALTVAKGGPKLKVAAPNESKPFGSMSLPDGGYITPYQRGGFPHMVFTSATMDGFAARLPGTVPVIDRTGLTGRYDFSLNWLSAGPDEENVGAVDLGDSDPLRHWDLGALGLKAEHIKLPTEKIVIDHIDRPSEN